MNGDSTQRYANVVVNGVGSTVAFVPTVGGVAMSSALTVKLNKGANTVMFEGINGGWGEFPSFVFSICCSACGLKM